MNIWELHPALVHFPMALLLSSVALDMPGWWPRPKDMTHETVGDRPPTDIREAIIL